MTKPSQELVQKPVPDKSDKPNEPTKVDKPEKTIEQLLGELELRQKQLDADCETAKEKLHSASAAALAALREYANVKEQYLVNAIKNLQQQNAKLKAEATPKRDDNVASA